MNGDALGIRQDVLFDGDRNVTQRVPGKKMICDLHG